MTGKIWKFLYHYSKCIYLYSKRKCARMIFFFLSSLAECVDINLQWLHSLSSRSLPQKFGDQHFFRIPHLQLGLCLCKIVYLTVTASNKIKIYRHRQCTQEIEDSQRGLYQAQKIFHRTKPTD